MKIRVNKEDRRLDQRRRLELGSLPCSMRTKKYVAGPTAQRRRMSMGSTEEGLSLEARRNKKKKKNRR